ncbi:MAG: NAD-dependent epimerase/dehydratase family protein [Thiolinea sp.]
MKILLTGASGFIGGHIYTALKNDGHQVITCSRQSGMDFNQLTSAEGWLPHLEDVDAVINAVGIIVENRQQRFDVIHRQAPVALFAACEQAGIAKVIQISALGVDEQAFTPYQLSKKAADDYLRNSSLSNFILRPSLVYGEGGASMKMFKQLASLPVMPLVGDGEYQVQPVHVSDLVATVQACLQQEASDGSETIDIVGAKALSFKDWLQAIRAAEGKKPALTLPTPFALMLGVAQIGRYIMPMMSPENLRMLRAGNTADVKPLTRFLGCSPLTPEQGLAL